MAWDRWATTRSDNLGGPTWFLPFYTGFNLNTGPLRGYEFSEFSGSRVMLANMELRVPFVRGILFGWPTTFLIPAIDGSMFVDVGTAWNRGDTLDLWPFFNPNTNPEQLQLEAEQRMSAGLSTRTPVRASVGFGLLVYFMLPINLNSPNKPTYKVITRTITSTLALVKAFEKRSYNRPRSIAIWLCPTQPV